MVGGADVLAALMQGFAGAGTSGTSAAAGAAAAGGPDLAALTAALGGAGAGSAAAGDGIDLAALFGAAAAGGIGGGVDDDEAANRMATDKETLAALPRVVLKDLAKDLPHYVRLQLSLVTSTPGTAAAGGSVSRAAAAEPVVAAEGAAPAGSTAPAAAPTADITAGSGAGGSAGSSARSSEGRHESLRVQAVYECVAIPASFSGPVPAPSVHHGGGPTAAAPHSTASTVDGAASAAAGAASEGVARLAAADVAHAPCLLEASPATGAAWTNAGAAAGAVVLFERGAISFARKGLQAQAAGAVAGIVVQAPERAKEWPLEMVDGGGEVEAAARAAAVAGTATVTARGRAGVSASTAAVGGDAAAGAHASATAPQQLSIPFVMVSVSDGAKIRRMLAAAAAATAAQTHDGQRTAGARASEANAASAPASSAAAAVAGAATPAASSAETAGVCSAAQQQPPQQQMHCSLRVHMTRARAGAAEECAICCEPFAVAQTVVTLPCQHVYHDACAMPWLQRRNLCPLCKHALPLGAEAQKAARAEAALREGFRQQQRLAEERESTAAGWYA
jgi:hypothetical protein